MYPNKIKTNTHGQAERRLIEAEQLVSGRPRLQGSREISAECTRKVHTLTFPCPALPDPVIGNRKLELLFPPGGDFWTQSRAWPTCHQDRRLIEAEQLVGGRPGLQGSRKISVEYTRKVHPLPCPALPWLILQTETEHWNSCSHPTTLRH